MVFYIITEGSSVRIFIRLFLAEYPQWLIVALRVLLGLFEAGMYPGIVFYISR